MTETDKEAWDAGEHEGCGKDTETLEEVRYLRSEAERLRTQLAKANAENEEIVRVCDSYAAENQRLFDRAEKATTQLAKARSAFDAAVATTTGNDFNTALVELCHILADDVGET